MNILILYFLVTCAPLSLTNGGVTYTTSAQDGKYVVDTVASFSCDSGFSLNGTNSAMCQESGNWNEKTSRCEGFYFIFWLKKLCSGFVQIITFYALVYFN